MIGWFRELRLHYPQIFWSSALCAALLAVSLLGLLIDNRTVLGINPWIKPIKFEISVGIFLVTCGWLLLKLDAAASAKWWIAWGVAATQTLEILAIVSQSARGVRSHFNESTMYDALVFALMGIAISATVAFVVWLLVLYFSAQSQLEPAILWGVRLGLVIFLLASAEGAWIVVNRGHTVGSADGGPGLPFLNWSTQYGDLRVAHFMGMHGIQLLPLVGWWFSRSQRDAGIPAVLVCFVLMLALFIFALVAALGGRPLLAEYH